MTAFHYEALDKEGRRKKGVLSADSIALARAELSRAGLSPLSLEAVAAQKDNGKQQDRLRIKPTMLVPLTRQLAVIVSAGAPVEEALQAVAMQMEDEAVNQILLGVRARVMEGWRLSEAMGEYRQSFSPLYRGIIAAGEQSGDLGTVLQRLATMQEKSRTLKMKALNALIYPAVLVIILVAVTIGLMVFVVPKIVEQFDMLGAELPLITRFVIGVSGFLGNWGWMLALVIALAGLGLWRAMGMAGPRLYLDRLILKLPIIGKLMRGLDAARFSRTAATLFASGAPLLDSLQAARRTMLNSHMGTQVDDAIVAVQEGAGLAPALRRSTAFPPMMVHMIAAGERSSALPVMLEKTADHLEAEFDNASTLFIRLLEPIIIVIMGIVVLTIMLAILTPMLQMNRLAAG